MVSLSYLFSINFLVLLKTDTLNRAYRHNEFFSGYNYIFSHSIQRFFWKFTQKCMTFFTVHGYIFPKDIFV